MTLCVSGQAGIVRSLKPCCPGLLLKSVVYTGTNYLSRNRIPKRLRMQTRRTHGLGTPVLR
nr:MAG TPA: hypothetical protein [Caudoviricetes sp.]DAX31136.1 MAG TPA: hypothetical protein [Caudoviricetes sp.]